MESLKIAILIPCYNEALTIEKVVNDFQAAIPSAQIYVYDNNSKDNTASIARKAGAIVGFQKNRAKPMWFSKCFATLTPIYM